MNSICKSCKRNLMGSKIDLDDLYLFELYELQEEFAVVRELTVLCF